MIKWIVSQLVAALVDGWSAFEWNQILFLIQLGNIGFATVAYFTVFSYESRAYVCPSLTVTVLNRTVAVPTNLDIASPRLVLVKSINKEWSRV